MGESKYGPCTACEEIGEVKRGTASPARWLIDPVHPVKNSIVVCDHHLMWGVVAATVYGFPATVALVQR